MQNLEQPNVQRKDEVHRDGPSHVVSTADPFADSTPPQPDASSPIMNALERSPSLHSTASSTDIADSNVSVDSASFAEKFKERQRRNSNPESPRANRRRSIKPELSLIPEEHAISPPGANASGGVTDNKPPPVLEEEEEEAEEEKRVDPPTEEQKAKESEEADKKVAEDGEKSDSEEKPKKGGIKTMAQIARESQARNAKNVRAQQQQLADHLSHTSTQKDQAAKIAQQLALGVMPGSHMPPNSSDTQSQGNVDNNINAFDRQSQTSEVHAPNAHHSRTSSADYAQLTGMNGIDQAYTGYDHSHHMDRPPAMGNHMRAQTHAPDTRSYDDSRYSPAPDTASNASAISGGSDFYSYTTTDTVANANGRHSPGFTAAETLSQGTANSSHTTGSSLSNLSMPTPGHARKRSTSSHTGSLHSHSAVHHSHTPTSPGFSSRKAPPLNGSHQPSPSAMMSPFRANDRAHRYFFCRLIIRIIRHIVIHTHAFRHFATLIS